jgi:hypothetical protein
MVRKTQIGAAVQGNVKAKVALFLGTTVGCFSVMEGCEKNVDAGHAAWLAARGVSSWCIARKEPLAKQLVPNDGTQETIFSTFTQTNPAHVVAEIMQFAGKGKRLGEVRQ